MSKKYGNYFPHYSNARNDTKVIDLIRKYGHAGYGYYFMMLEIMREQPDFKCHINQLGTMAYDIRIDVEVVSDIVKNSGLFVVDEDMFFSPKFVEIMQPLVAMSQGGKKGMNSRWNDDQDKGLHKGLNSPLYNKKKINKENKGRREEFQQRCLEFENKTTKYGVVKFNDIDEFCLYWCEPLNNKPNTMLFETMKTWDTWRRLITWMKKKEEFKK